VQRLGECLLACEEVGVRDGLCGGAVGAERLRPFISAGDMRSEYRNKGDIDREEEQDA